MIDFGIEHGFENDIASLFRREGLDGQFGIAERQGVEFGQVFELAIEAPGEPWQGNVELVDVLFRRFSINFDDQGVLPITSTGAAHRDTVKGNTLVLNGLDELHEGGRTHHRNGLALVSAKIHPAQAATQSLFRQDIALGSISAQSDNNSHVAHVPAFLEHQHRHDRLVGRLPGIDLICLLAQKLQLVFALT